MASIAYHLASRWARLRRRQYAARLPAIAALPLPNPNTPTLPATLVAFCGTRDLPEQIASWRSFRIHVGRPTRTVLVSDGSLGPDHTTLLRTLEPRLEIRSLEEFAGDLATPRMRSYAESMPMGRKLFVMRGLDRLAPCLYADSDILFFPAARELAGPAIWSSPEPRYLLDPYPSLDPRLIRHPADAEAPVNGGFVILKQPACWTEPLALFDTLPGDPAFFTEQTLNHLAIRRAAGTPLDPTRYILRNEDQWTATDHFAGPGVALRHYISSFRHKMWLRIRTRAGSATTRT